MALINEIEENSKKISTESYPMSIGEIISMYKEGDLEIHPEFQRFFRWTDSQKTKLIESLLLNIPIPPIFVSQREDGMWDVIDGLQRLSTIFHFVGIYKDEHGNIQDPLVLLGTEMLPSLNGLYYDNEQDSDHSMPMEIKRYFKRAKLDFVIIRKESDKSSKYEIFQRLNTGGTNLSGQEVRNCIMIMEDPEKFNIIRELSEYQPFVDTLRLSDSSFEERYDMELVTRFICLRNENPNNLKGVTDFGEYLDKKIVNLFHDNEFDWNTEKEIFKRCFALINNKLGDSAFQKFDIEANKFKGRFYASAFEFVAVGLGKKQGIIPEEFDLREKVKDIWNTIEIESISWKGASASGRLSKTMNIATRLYNYE